MDRDHPLRARLRTSDTIQCMLDVQLASENSNPQPPRSDPTRQRLIAIVTHRSHAHDIEFGSLFILSLSTANGPGRVVDALPITEYLTVAVAQTGPLGSERDLVVSTESWSGWLLSIKRDTQDTKSLACTIHTRDTPNLQSFTAECRRLKEIAVAAHPPATDFTWTETYLSHLSSRRDDLRLRRQPLHTRLSPAIAGFSANDVSDISVVKRDWVERVATKEASSDNAKHLKIRLGTFNVNGKSPSQDLNPWLCGLGSQNKAKTDWIPPLNISTSEVSLDSFHQKSRENSLLSVPPDKPAFGEPDLLVLGFQELDLSTEALLYATSTLKEDEWLTAIFAGLGEKHVLYEKLISRQLVGMLLVVIAKKALVPCFTDVRSCDAGSGIMGFMGNKGATAIRLEFTPKDPQIGICRSIVLTFVNAHLAASDEMVERRHSDFQELSGRLTFSSSHALNEAYPLSLSAEDTYNTYQTDVLFWMVHLNYRLDLPDGDIRELLSSHVSGIDSIGALLSYDQLNAAIRNKRAFVGLMEHQIAHIPTYRFSPGVSKDGLGYDMKRKPAWTDRILYMADPDVRVSQVAYRSHSEIVMSDHKPVSADFDIALTLTNQSQYENLLLALHRELDDFEDVERKPKIKIRPVAIEFGNIGYKQLIHEEVTIRNEGNIPCVFRFVPASVDSDRVSPAWLRIDPIVGLLRAHETTRISLSAYVDDKSAAELNLRSPTLDCTLILHTALGKDDFLCVSGNYEYTCFANTLDRLTRLAGPIRKLTSPEAILPTEQAINAPREIMRLINWLMTHVSATDGVCTYPAQERLCHAIRECLDTGDEFPAEGPDWNEGVLVAAFESTLVALLDSLIEPVVPARLHAQCLQAKDKDEAFEALNAFPHESINVWISLTAFLHYIAQQGDSDASRPRRADRLASMLAPVLLRDDTTGGHPRASPVGKRDFLLLFID